MVERLADLICGEWRRHLVPLFPGGDGRLGGGEVALDLLGRDHGEVRVHPGADRCEDSVELHRQIPERLAGGYYLWRPYRRAVTDALVRQLVASELVRPQPAIEYWLVAGRIASGQAVALSEHFEANGWTLRDRSWIRQTLALLDGDGYEDDVVTMAAKLLAD